MALGSVKISQQKFRRKEDGKIFTRVMTVSLKRNNSNEPKAEWK